MANSFQKLADILNIENARLSGDPRRLQVASQMQETKELKQATAQSEAEINKAIDESNLPESQKRLLKALSLKEKAALFLETQKPEKGLTPNEMVKMEEAKVLQKLRIVNGDVTKLTPYEKNRMARKNITYKKQHKPEHKSSNSNNKVNNMLKLINGGTMVVP